MAGSANGGDFNNWLQYLPPGLMNRFQAAPGIAPPAPTPPVPNVTPMPLPAAPVTPPVAPTSVPTPPATPQGLATAAENTTLPSRIGALFPGFSNPVGVPDARPNFSGVPTQASPMAITRQPRAVTTSPIQPMSRRPQA